MHILFESYENILDDKTGYGRKIVEEIIDNVMKQATAYCKGQIAYYKKHYNISIEVNLDELRACQAVIDTLEDLMRLKDFHPVQHPNRLKCAAYLAYWWLQRQPINFSVSNEDFNKLVENSNNSAQDSKIKVKEDIAHIIHTNAFWLVAYVLGEIFSTKTLSCKTDERQEHWEVEFKYLFYYFCYRAISPKSIEAFLSTSILHPIWEVKPGVSVKKL